MRYEQMLEQFKKHGAVIESPLRRMEDTRPCENVTPPAWWTPEHIDGVCGAPAAFKIDGARYCGVHAIQKLEEMLIERMISERR